MKNLKRKSFKYLFYISIAVYFFFVLSASITGALNIFFDHVTAGQDFYQIPNGAFSFIHGGTLKGDKIPGVARYTECCGVNDNVYHPFFTLLIGAPLILFSPRVAYYIWVAIHILFAITAILIIYKKFGSHKLIFLALSVFLLNSYNHYELQHAQYHFLFSFFTMLFILEEQRKGNSTKAGVWFFLSLLVKPIGFLWIVPLLIYKRWRTLAIGLGLFAVVSIPFLFLPQSTYYFTNLLNNILAKYASYNLMAITHLVTINTKYLNYLMYAVALLLILYQIVKKPSIYKIIVLWTCFQIVFYSGVYHYYYAIFAYLLLIGIVLNEIKIGFLQGLAILFLTLPTPIVFFHLAGYPEILPPVQLSISAMWSVFFLILFCLNLIFQKPRLAAR